MARATAREGGKPSENSEKEKPRKEVLKIDGHLMEEMLRVSCGRFTMKDLESLISSILRKIEPHLNLSEKTMETAEIEKHQIKQLLIFFEFTYRDIPEPKRNLDYLSKMTDLLAHYIGVEVLTSADPFDGDSREGKDLISRVITTVYTSLASSEDHILDTMMKLWAPFEKNTPKKDILVYSELFKIVLKKAQKRQENDLTYMRYVLVYRLLKKMVKKKDDTKLKEMIIKKASKRLKPPPGFTKRRSALPKVLPKPPKNTKNITEFFLRKKYNVQETVKKFLDETKQATHQRTMFPNLSCDPRLLNPKIRESESLPPLNAPVQEFSTFMSTADDVWQRLHEEPHSESSVFEKVTALKKIPICTPNRVYNLLHSHYFQRKARKAEMRKRALRDACFRDMSVVGGIISSHRISGSLSDGYGLSNTSNPKNRNSPTVKAHKRRILESPDVHLSKKSKSDLWEENHIPVHPSYAAGSLQKDPQSAKSFCENPSKSLGGTVEIGIEHEKELGCSSNGNLISDVKSEVKEEPNGSQSGSSCDSPRFDDPNPPGKLAIEKEVEQTLQMLQKSKPAPIQPSPSFDISPIKAEDLGPMVGLETPTCLRPEVGANWNSIWGPMGYGQTQDLNSSEDPGLWLDELLAYPSSTGPEGQDFWSLITGDEISDYS